MIALISCAKTMETKQKAPSVPRLTVPEFDDLARKNAFALSKYSAEELARALCVNAKIAAENKLRYDDFFVPGRRPMPAICAYTGMVFKHISPSDFSVEDYEYAQGHLFITSFLYGLLRPLDGIRPYRLEGNVCLPENGGVSMFDFWKPRLTEFFIGEVKRRGGVLLNIASAEMKNLFDWPRVEQAVRVVTPEFRVWKDGALKTTTVYAKMCRGEMARFMLKNRIEHPDDLKSFEWEGFSFEPELSSGDRLLFAL